MPQQPWPQQSEVTRGRSSCSTHLSAWAAAPRCAPSSEVAWPAATLLTCPAPCHHAIPFLPEPPVKHSPPGSPGPPSPPPPPGSAPPAPWAACRPARRSRRGATTTSGTRGRHTLKVRILPASQGAGHCQTGSAVWHPPAACVQQRAAAQGLHARSGGSAPHLHEFLQLGLLLLGPLALLLFLGLDLWQHLQREDGWATAAHRWAGFKGTAAGYLVANTAKHERKGGAVPKAWPASTTDGYTSTSEFSYRQATRQNLQACLHAVTSFVNCTPHLCCHEGIKWINLIPLLVQQALLLLRQRRHRRRYKLWLGRCNILWLGCCYKPWRGRRCCRSRRLRRFCCHSLLLPPCLQLGQASSLLVFLRLPSSAPCRRRCCRGYRLGPFRGPSWRGLLLPAATLPGAAAAAFATPVTGAAAAAITPALSRARALVPPVTA